MSNIQQPISEEDFKTFDHRTLNENTDINQLLDHVLVASDVFIKPTATTGTNIAILTILCSKLLVSLSKLINDGETKFEQTKKHYFFIKQVYKSQYCGDHTDSDEDYAIFKQILENRIQLLFELRSYYKRAKNVFKKVERLVQLGQSLLALNKKYGSRILKRYMALRRLTIIMVCTDYVWKDIRKAREKLGKKTQDVAQLSAIEVSFWVPVIDDNGNEVAQIKRTLDDECKETYLQ